MRQDTAAEEQPNPIPRVAARVVLVDPSDEILLIKSHDPTVAGSPVWWHVPGGGLDPGESPRQGAIREIAEEVGIRLADVGPTVGTRTTRFTFTGRSYIQRESFFVVRIPERVDVDPAAWTDLERRSTLGWAWWSVEAVAASTETIYPRGLVALVTGWLASGPGPEPVTVT